MTNSEQNVQVCDTTKVDSYRTVGQQKNICYMVVCHGTSFKWPLEIISHYYTSYALINLTK